VSSLQAVLTVNPSHLSLQGLTRSLRLLTSTIWSPTPFPTSVPNSEPSSTIRFVSLINVDLGLTQYFHRTEGTREATGLSGSGYLCERCMQTRNKPRVYGNCWSRAGESSLFYPMTPSCSLRIFIGPSAAQTWRKLYSWIYQRTCWGCCIRCDEDADTG